MLLHLQALNFLSFCQADQTGTIAQILAEDGKPVSVDTVNPNLSLSLFIDKYIYVCVCVYLFALSILCI